MTAQTIDTFSSLTTQQQKESVENVKETTKNAQENIRAADSKANFLGTGGGTLAIAAATLVGSSPDNLSNLLKGLLLFAALFLMAAVVATQYAVYPRTKCLNNKSLSKEDLSKQMLATDSEEFMQSKYNRLLDECHYLTAHILPIKNKWIKISIWLGWVGVSVLAVATVSWMVTLFV
ncbi:hypothetical protein MK805_11040 [Shimazuella sp. AN120528]|uniref:hypothetical protein n=1 Tax=Shimazuella soli TaxID=1892854 RepID=UPI001F0DB81E|nr:hypothetical protein [Shimazuella soli]MCH5585487.1 hypothetical protein [Shimazuella soli]